MTVAVWLVVAVLGTTHQLRGLVIDISGAPVANARVVLEAGDARLVETRTAADGRFEIEAPSTTESLVVKASAPGFAEAVVRLTPAEPAELRLVLQPMTLAESVTVTASRGVERLATPASASVLSSAELTNAPTVTVDDTLRNTPGFSLFRRSSSRVANPSAQGVTLRGLSGSGASRTLVLADGLPLNDPFGSWVYWNRVPRAAIDRIEVVRGAAGDVYGADALGGVIQILTFTGMPARVRATVDGASAGTVRASAFAGYQARGWTGRAAGERLRTDGVIVVARDERGAVDAPARSEYDTVFVAIGHDAGRWRTIGRFSTFAEARNNGTPLVTNDTNWRQFSAEAAGMVGGGAWLGQVAGGTQRYFNNFSAVAAGRATERVTSEQRIPSRFFNVGGQWTRPAGRHTLLVGAEGRRTEATVHETRFSPAGVPSGPFLAGGSEVVASAYGRAGIEAGDRLSIVIGMRGDFWRSEPEEATAPRHAVDFFSPRASLAWRASPALSVQTSAYRAYRTPTLNELHRGFRVGSTVTDGNPLLQPERLTGVEGGILWARRGVSARATGFYNHLDEAITNVTLSATPQLIRRQKQNADKVRAAGLEVEADLRLAPRLTVSALAVLTASHFREEAHQPALEGKRVPQVASYQFGAGLSYSDVRSLTIAVAARFVGPQFEDDLNQLRLDRFAVVDWSASRALARGSHVFVAVENLFDVEYDAGRTPVRTIGWPRTVRAGLRLFMP